MHKDPKANLGLQTAWRLAMCWIILSLAGLVVSLASLDIDRSGTPAAHHFNLQNLWPFWLFSACVWAGLTALWLLLRRLPNVHSGDFRRTMLIVFGVAVVARTAVIITAEPSLSDDIYRYVFDGRNLAAGLNPYLVKPADRRNADSERWPGESQLVPLLAYGEMTTPYMPLSQYVLGAFGLAAHGGNSDPHSSARIFRIGFVLVDLILIAILFVAVRHRGTSPWWVALYAWHPLPIAEVASAGHQDVVGAGLLAAALTAFSARPARVALWSALLSAAAMVKPVAAPAAVFMLRGRPWRAWLTSLIVGLIVALLVALPLRWIPWVSSAPFQNWYATASEMSDKWSHFAAAYETTEFATRHLIPATEHSPAGWNLVQERRARMACMAMLAVVFLIIFWLRMDPWRSTAALMVAIVLLSTTAHPWYLLWGLALAPLAMSWTLWTYSLTISLGYIVFVTGKGTLAGEEWTVPVWALAAGYAPVLAALVADLLQLRRSQGNPS